MLLRRIVRVAPKFSLFTIYLPRPFRYISCWRCANPYEENGSHCSKCQATFDHTKVNYFELFGLPVNYNVDNTDIVSSFHKLQIQFHPDKHSNETKTVQDIAQNFSVLVNRAYKTLSSPIDRGIYVLNLNNVPLDLTSTDDKELLFEVLEIDDEISTLSEKQCALDLKNSLLAKLEKLKKELSDTFRKEDYIQARELVVKMRYFLNLFNKCEDKIMKLE